MKNIKINNTEQSKGAIVIYKAKSGGIKLNVKLEKDTVWLTQKQIAKLFLTERSVVTKHIGNIFQSKELDEDSVCAIFAHTALDGKEYKTKFYNLDTIISVGYRVNSNRATQFRMWASKILKDYLVKGYSLNQRRLIEKEGTLKDLQETIAFISGKTAHPQLTGKGGELIKLLNEYASALTILHEYDNKSLALAKRKRPIFVLKYETASEIIYDVGTRLREKKEASELFGREVGHKFKSIIGALYQTFDRKDLYASIEEKAAHLLYLTIKDHPFSDGNKRLASILFVYFLERNNYMRKLRGELKINDNTIVALALLIAASDPREKDMMIKIITNLLK